MLDVEWLILGDSAQVVGNKLFLQGGGWDRLTINKAFPAEHAIGIAVAIKVPWDETNEKHEFELEIISEDGETINKTSGIFESGRPAGAPPGDQRVQFAINIIMHFGKPGAFAVVARIDGEEQRRVDFRVVAGIKVTA